MKKIISMIMVFALLAGNLTPLTVYALETTETTVPMETVAEETVQAEESVEVTVSEIAETVLADASIVESGTCGDNLTWTLDSDGLLTISGSGEMDDCSVSSAPWKMVGKIISVVVEEGVTYIGDYAFYNAENMVSASLPESLTEIGDYAFYRAESMVSISMPETLSKIGGNAFGYCTSLKNIVIPDGVTTIESYTFSHCSSLCDVTLPEGLRYIKSNAFDNCTSLAEITFPESLEQLNSSFHGCTALTSVMLPSKVRYINNGPFADCTSLKEILVDDSNKYFTSVDGVLLTEDGTELVQYPAGRTGAYTIPEGTTSVGFFAFCGAAGLTEITIPNSVTEMEPQAFMDCTGLTEFVIPGGMTTLPDNMLNGCTGLTKIEIPASVTTISGQAFSGCTGMTSFSIPSSVTSIGGGAFSDCTNLVKLDLPDGISEIPNSLFSGCTSLTHVDIPDSVTCIGWTVFEDCSSLTELTIPSSVTTVSVWGLFMGCSSLKEMVIPDTVVAFNDAGCAGMFADCTSLESVSLPDSLTFIDDNMFNGCTSLESIEIPNYVTTIGSSAFYQCTGLTSITIPASVTKIDSYAFQMCASLKKVIFQGDAPSINSFAFQGITTTAYYPSGNTTWTESVRDDYGGTITWVAGDGTELEGPAADFAWTYADGVLTISGNGPMGDYTQTTMPWYEYDDEITTVIVNEGITSVGSYAFCNFDHITSVTLPETITRIGQYAFYNAYHMESVTIPESTTLIERYAFSCCDGLTGLLMIPGSVTDIGDYAFSDCDGLEHVKTDDGTLYIGEAAFSDCGALEGVTITSTVIRIEEMAFGDCTRLREISVGSDNAYYYSENGVLFNKDRTQLIQFPCGIGGFYEVPESVTAVGQFAFRSCISQYIRFTGDAPSFENYSFYNATTTVRYPLGNDTWTEDVKQNYGGTITWFATDTRVPQEAQTIEGDFLYQSNVTGNQEAYSFAYDDNWFYGSSTKYNHELARMSLCMAMSAAWTDPDYIEDLFDKLGLTNTVIEYPTPTTETIGYAIGSKKIIDENEEIVTLITVAVRGGGYQTEWADNTNVGTSGDHTGFKTAADKVYAALKQYIADIGADDNIRIWMTGFSRAAAITNLAAHSVNEGAAAGEIPGLTKNNVFAYCFACPQGTISTDHADNNIFNIVCTNDIVPMVAPADDGWDFGRYGITYNIPAEATAYNDYVYIFNEMKSEYGNIIKAAYDGYSDSTAITASSAEALKRTSFQEFQGQLMQDLISGFAGICDRTTYYKELQDTVCDLLETATADNPEFGIGDVVEAILTGKNILDWIKETDKTFLEFVKDYVAAGPVDCINYAHCPEFYLAWMNVLDGESDYVDPYTRTLRINCPVDVSVYDSKGILVAQIINDEVQEIEDSEIDAMIDQNGQKLIALPFDEEFSIEITATDDGTMSCQIEEYDIAAGEATRVVNYYDIEITEGDQLTGTAGTSADSAAEYVLLDTEKNEISATNDLSGSEISTYTVYVSGEGNGTAGGGGRFTVGEYAKVTAEPDNGEEFLGWYVKDELVSQETEYRFRVEKDTTIVGKFTEYGLNVTRVSGNSRYETSFAIAEQLKEVLGVEKFDTIIVASGESYPDALSGSYLSTVKSAPILLTNKSMNSTVLAYIQENLSQNGMVYILGGVNSVTQSFEDSLDEAGIENKRLAGDNRMETNLAILEEAGVNGGKILISTAYNYADTLSASASGLPILLLNTDANKLTDAQKAFLEENSDCELYIVGGVNTVSEKLAAEIEEYGEVERISGDTREETSIKVASFIENPECVVLAYSRNYPDGLCGGVLAYNLKAPVILTNSGMEDLAVAYVEENGISEGVVLGGVNSVKDSSVRTIFDMDNEDIIEEVTYVIKK